MVDVRVLGRDRVRVTYSTAPGVYRALIAKRVVMACPKHVLPAAEVREVERLVLATIRHDPEPGDPAAELLMDADLSVLGLIRGRYHIYARDVREEYARYDDEQFSRGRVQVIDDLLARQQLFRTERGRQLWQATARLNLAEERARLLSGNGPGRDRVRLS